RRPPRRPAPEMPDGEVVLEGPPEVTGSPGSRQPLLLILPTLGSVAVALMFATGAGGPVAYLAGGLAGLAALGLLAGQLTAGRPALQEERRTYLRYLAQLRRRLRQTVAVQRTALRYRHPDPADLWALVDGPRLWERRPDDRDFAV